VVVGFSPEMVVVGGEISRAWPLIEEALSETIERSVRRGLTFRPHNAFKPWAQIQA